MEHLRKTKGNDLDMFMQRALEDGNGNSSDSNWEQVY